MEIINLNIKINITYKSIKLINLDKNNFNNSLK